LSTANRISNSIMSGTFLRIRNHVPSCCCRMRFAARFSLEINASCFNTLRILVTLFIVLKITVTILTAMFLRSLSYTLFTLMSVTAVESCCGFLFTAESTVSDLYQKGMSSLSPKLPPPPPELPP
jgi:hypothetical protein